MAGIEWIKYAVNIPVVSEWSFLETYFMTYFIGLVIYNFNAANTFNLHHN